MSGPLTSTGAHLVDDRLEPATPQLRLEVLGELPDERGLEGVAARAQRAAHQPRALPHHRPQVQVLYSCPCRTRTGLLDSLVVCSALYTSQRGMCSQCHPLKALQYQVNYVSIALLTQNVSLHDKLSSHVISRFTLSSSVQHHGGSAMLKPATSSRRPARMLHRLLARSHALPDTARAHAASNTNARLSVLHVAWSTRTAERADQDDGPIRREAVDIPRQVRRPAPHGHHKRCSQQGLARGGKNNHSSNQAHVQ